MLIQSISNVMKVIKIFTILPELLHISSHDRADVKYQSDISEVLFSSSASAADAFADVWIRNQFTLAAQLASSLQYV